MAEEEIKEWIETRRAIGVPKIISIFTDKHLPSCGRVYPSKHLKHYCTKYEFVSNRLVIAYPKQDKLNWRYFQLSLSKRRLSQGVEFHEIHEDDIEAIRMSVKEVE